VSTVINGGGAVETEGKTTGVPPVAGETPALPKSHFQRRFNAGWCEHGSPAQESAEKEAGLCLYGAAFGVTSRPSLGASQRSKSSTNS